MNNKLKKVAKNLTGKNGIKNLVISIVILVEVIAIAMVASYAWVETVSSIKIATRNSQNQDDPLVVDSYVFTEAMIGEGKGTIDLANYFKKSGDMHLAPASSADGERMFFPKATANAAAYQTGSRSFRKGDFSDKNTAYMSISFKLRADVNADFFFTQVPTFSNQGDNIRVSVTAYTEGMSSGDLYDAETGLPNYTQIYANSDSPANTKVVGNTSGTAVATSYEAFGDHIKGKGSTAKLFSVAADETKIVTINLWLQGSSLDNTLPEDILISNFGIISDLTPRHVTLIPTNRWDTGGTAYYYAWCWMDNNSIPSRLYKLSLDDNEHYSFDFNGKYDHTLFFKSEDDTLTTDNMSSHWNSTTIKFKSVDTAIPASPVDPTYVITELRGGDADNDLGGAKKSKGVWALPDIVTIKTATVTGQSSWGTITSASYYGTTVTSSQQVEANNSSNANAKHHDTIHALPGKRVRLGATVSNANYAFVGWYDNAAGTGTALSTDATYDFNATTEAPKEVTYYAKFKEVRKLTIVKYLDGVATNTTTARDVGSITIGTNTSANDDVTSYSQTYDKGTSLDFSAAASDGYTLTGIYTTATGGNSVSSVTLDDNTTYYARFTTNSYDVTATVIGSGGTVKVGSATAGSTSTASVKYKSSVNVVAAPASGYDFDGWYSEDDEFLSANTTYTVSMSTVGDKEVFAKFKEQKTTTIYMTNRGYSKMRVYVYGKSTGREYNGAFPGSTVPTYTGNRGLYSYSFKTGQDEDIGIIVSDNGDTNKRSEYTAHIGETMLIGPSGSTINRSFTLGTKRYVYFTKHWTNNYIHYWGASSGNTSWPGNNMNSNKAYTNEYNQDVLYYVITTNHTKVIFHNNSGTQTGDTTLGSNSCFYFNGANNAAGTWTPSTD